jgi:proline dehydrogenase
MDLSFDNTETAFAYKSDKELKSGRWLLKTMHYPWFVAVGSRLTPFLMKTGLPVHGIIRKTISNNLSGGSHWKIQNLFASYWQTIMYR